MAKAVRLSGSGGLNDIREELTAIAIWCEHVIRSRRLADVELEEIVDNKRETTTLSRKLDAVARAWGFWNELAAVQNLLRLIPSAIVAVDKSTSNAYTNLPADVKVMENAIDDLAERYALVAKKVGRWPDRGRTIRDVIRKHRITLHFTSEEVFRPSMASRLIADYLEIKTEKGKREEIVCDLGTGSGLLAILAIKMGAKKAYAIDINKDAIESVITNIDLNNIEKGEIEPLLVEPDPKKVYQTDFFKPLRDRKKRLVKDHKEIEGTISRNISHIPQGLVKLSRRGVISEEQARELLAEVNSVEDTTAYEKLRKLSELIERVRGYVDAKAAISVDWKEKTASASKQLVGMSEWCEAAMSRLEEVDEGLKELEFDVIITNPPQVAIASAIENAALQSLSGGPDGSKFICNLIECAPEFLKHRVVDMDGKILHEGGRLYTLISSVAAPHKTARALHKAGFDVEYLTIGTELEEVRGMGPTWLKPAGFIYPDALEILPPKIIRDAPEGEAEDQWNQYIDHIFSQVRCYTHDEPKEYTKVSQKKLPTGESIKGYTGVEEYTSVWDWPYLRIEVDAIGSKRYFRRLYMICATLRAPSRKRQRAVVVTE